jgi:hypothetical protein
MRNTLLRYGENITYVENKRKSLSVVNMLLRCRCILSYVFYITWKCTFEEHFAELFLKLSRDNNRVNMPDMLCSMDTSQLV